MSQRGRWAPRSPSSTLRDAGAWLSWLERSLHTAEVGGSSPSAPTSVVGERETEGRRRAKAADKTAGPAQTARPPHGTDTDHGTTAPGSRTGRTAAPAGRTAGTAGRDGDLRSRGPETKTRRLPAGLLLDSLTRYVGAETTAAVVIRKHMVRGVAPIRQACTQLGLPGGGNPDCPPSSWPSI